MLDVPVRSKRGRPRSEIVLTSFVCERAVLQWLRNYLPTAKPAKFHDSFDIFYGDRRIEVKASEFNGECWRFNIHRHGVINETGIYAYIFRLDNVPGFIPCAIHLVIPAPIRRSTIAISMRSLLTYWGRFFNRVDYIEPIKELRKLGHKNQVGDGTLVVTENLSN